MAYKNRWGFFIKAWNFAYRLYLMCRKRIAQAFFEIFFFHPVMTWRDMTRHVKTCKNLKKIKKIVFFCLKMFFNIKNTCMKDFCKKKICYGMTWHEKWVKKEPKRQKNAKNSKESLKKPKIFICLVLAYPSEQGCI